jgi:hypothetical protein
VKKFAITEEEQVRGEKLQGQRKSMYNDENIEIAEEKYVRRKNFE